MASGVSYYVYYIEYFEVSLAMLRDSIIMIDDIYVRWSYEIFSVSVHSAKIVNEGLNQTP